MMLTGSACSAKWAQPISSGTRTYKTTWRASIKLATSPHRDGHTVPEPSGSIPIELRSVA